MWYRVSDWFTVPVVRIAVSVVAFSVAVVPAMAQAPDETDRVRRALEVLESLTGAPDRDIPQAILDGADAIVIIPNLVKGGFIVGAQHGRGVMSVREGGRWSAPSFVALTGGSVGWQIGAESVDLVLLVMNREGVDELLKSEFKLGAGASVAAGPVGRAAEASTDARLDAQILAYSRAKGLFAGATVHGASLRTDEDANRRYYGRTVEPAEIFAGRVSGQAGAADWSAALARLTGTATARR